MLWAIVVQVTGQLQENLTSWDALRAALPVGTVSGAPKVELLSLLLLFWIFGWFRLAHNSHALLVLYIHSICVAHAI